MKTIFHLEQWPNHKKKIEIETVDTSSARIYIFENYPDWKISMMIPEPPPPPTPPPDPFPSIFYVPKHLRPMIQDDNFGVKLYSCDKHGVRL